MGVADDYAKHEPCHKGGYIIYGMSCVCTAWSISETCFSFNTKNDLGTDCDQFNL